MRARLLNAFEPVCCGPVATRPFAPEIEPSISADGQRVAFVRRRDGNAEIYVVNDDGTGLTNVSNDGANDSDPSISAP